MLTRKITRREACLLLGTVAGTALLPKDLFAAISIEDIVGSWEVGRSVGISYQPIETLQLPDIKQAGFSCLELSFAAPAFAQTPEEKRLEWCKEVRQQADAAGLKLRSVHVPFGGAWDISFIDEEKRKNAVQMAIPFFELKEILGAKYYIIHPSAEPIAPEDRPKRIEQSIKSLKELAAAAKAKGVIITVENLPRTCLGNTGKELVEIVDAVGSPKTVKICFDSNHPLQEKPEDFVAAVGNRIATTHMSDYDTIDGKLDERHWLPYEGCINWKAVVAAMVKAGYPGPFVFETSRFKDGTPATNAEIFERWQRIKREFDVKT
ncbi:MAG: sugar phosphate isomerase/epimerase [Planctomycetaceae bacterium]|nr:sugar phosphate isomerase/epimerase [Planctomycetaceae bacterium]